MLLEFMKKWHFFAAVSFLFKINNDLETIVVRQDVEAVIVFVDEKAGEI